MKVPDYCRLYIKDNLNEEKNVDCKKYSFFFIFYFIFYFCLKVYDKVYEEALDYFRINAYSKFEKTNIFKRLMDHHVGVSRKKAIFFDNVFLIIYLFIFILIFFIFFDNVF